MRHCHKTSDTNTDNRFDKRKVEVHSKMQGTRNSQTRIMNWSNTIKVRELKEKVKDRNIH